MLMNPGIAAQGRPTVPIPFLSPSHHFRAAACRRDRELWACTKRWQTGLCRRDRRGITRVALGSRPWEREHGRRGNFQILCGSGSRERELRWLQGAGALRSRCVEAAWFPQGSEGRDRLPLPFSDQRIPPVILLHAPGSHQRRHQASMRARRRVAFSPVPGPVLRNPSSVGARVSEQHRAACGDRHAPNMSSRASAGITNTRCRRRYWLRSWRTRPTERTTRKRPDAGLPRTVQNQSFQRLVEHLDARARQRVARTILRSQKCATLLLQSRPGARCTFRGQRPYVLSVSIHQTGKATCKKLYWPSRHS